MGLSKEVIDALMANEVCQLGSAATSLKADVVVPASVAAGPAEKPGKIEGKMKVLFLPGRQSNQNLAGFQLNALKGVIGKESEITILDGPMIWKYKEGHDLHDADQMSISLSKNQPFLTWFDVDSSDKRRRPYMWKFFDPAATINYKGADDAIDTLLKKLEGETFDVVMGLFEGCIVIHMAIAKLMNLGKPVPWKLTVCFGSMPIRDATYMGGFASGKCDTPAVLTFGKIDQDYHYSRTGAGMKPSEEYYSSATILEGMWGHAMPTDATVYQRVLEEMKWVCGLSPKKPEKLAIPPRPSSFALLNVGAMVVRKLRVLSLCGGHSLETINKVGTASLKAALGPDAEWTYIAGTKAWTYYKGEPVVSEMEERLAGGKQLYNWYLDYAFEESDRMNSKKQFDKNVKVEFYDIEEVIDYWIKWIEDNGPFDVVVAFSQGCILLHMLIGKLRQRKIDAHDADPGDMSGTEASLAVEERLRNNHRLSSAEEMPWRISVFFSGMHIRDPRYQHLGGGGADGTPCPHPTIFVYGTKDEYYEYARDGFGTTPKTQEEYYANPLILVGDHDHEFPTQQPRAKQIYDQVVAKIWYHCGGQPDKPKVAPKAVTGGSSGKSDLKALVGPPAK